MRDRSYQIDRQIEEDSRRYRKECKILLLGAFTLSIPARHPAKMDAQVRERVGRAPWSNR